MINSILKTDGSANAAQEDCAAGRYFTTFAKGQWDRADWVAVKSPRWDYMSDFVQHDDHIANITPDLPDEIIFRDHESEVYSCIMLDRAYRGDCVISSAMSFDHRMAPLIVLTPEIGKSAKGEPEHRDHFEIVLYDEGINVWHHFWKDGKPSWCRTAFLQAKYKPKQIYTLEVKLENTDKGRMMTISCDGKSFGYMDESLPESYYAGITGCEGRNRFYDFSIELL